MEKAQERMKIIRERNRCMIINETHNKNKRQNLASTKHQKTETN